ncbi:hypothetical protein QUF58_04300 [Anaerolineales bacterium HSG24]|nr:hypothetical protein [Anaerolineales bacterium HSG24]
MTALPPDLLNRLSDTLSDCDYFDNHDRLQALFVDARIHAWGDGLPQTNSLSSRVSQTVRYLLPKVNHANENENGLVLFLHVLVDQYDPADQMLYTIQGLAVEVAEALSSTPSEPRPWETARPVSTSKQAARPNSAMILNRKQFRKLHAILKESFSWDDIRIFGYDHQPDIYKLPTSISLDDMLWALLDAANEAQDYSPIMEALLKSRHRSAYEAFMEWLEESGLPKPKPTPERPVAPPTPKKPNIFALNNPTKLTFKGKRILINALLECPAISDRARRNTVIDNLPGPVQQTITRSNVALDDVANLVNACEKHNGFADLLEVLEFFEQSSQPFQRVQVLFQ